MMPGKPLPTMAEADALPLCFFFTDSGRTPDLPGVIATLPARCGIIFRHYRVPNRMALAISALAAARARGLPLLIGGDPEMAAHIGADGIHLPEGLVSRHRVQAARRQGMVTASAHNLRAAIRARELGIDLLFVAPVYPTLSHPHKRALGPLRAAVIARAFGGRAYALGGVTAARAKTLEKCGFSGYGAIGDLLGRKSQRQMPDQKLTRVPR